MSPDEILADADEAAKSFAAVIAAQSSRSTGLPSPPSIEVSEVVLNTRLIPFKMNRGQPTQVFQEAPS